MAKGGGDWKLRGAGGEVAPVAKFRHAPGEVARPPRPREKMPRLAPDPAAQRKLFVGESLPQTGCSRVSVRSLLRSGSANQSRWTSPTSDEPLTRRLPVTPAAARSVGQEPVLRPCETSAARIRRPPYIHTMSCHIASTLTWIPGVTDLFCTPPPGPGFGRTEYMSVGFEPLPEII